MNYDCIIIGAGLSGLVCGIKCASAGLRTAIFSGGRNALHFSSGSIDLYGFDDEGKAVRNPVHYIEENVIKKKNHPYSKVGLNDTLEALTFFKESLSAQDLVLNGLKENNHFHVTGAGTVKPTFLSQRSVFSDRIAEAFRGTGPIAVLNFKGYRDYYAAITVDIMKRNPLFNNRKIFVGNIALPHYTRTERNLHEYRSIDLARVFDSEKYLPRIADEIRQACGDAEIISLPAFIGINNFNNVYDRLSSMTGRVIYEIPSLPPSILGMRIDQALRSQFAALGGELSEGDRVVGGEIIDGKVDHIHTEHYGDTRHRASYYVMSTGSFFSGGLSSSFNRLDEPIFSLPVSGSENRRDWYSPEFFDKKSHPFLEYGVVTDENLHPLYNNDEPVDNLFCTGALLSGYNPIKEGSGGGIAVATGYSAAKAIISRTGKG